MYYDTDTDRELGLFRNSVRHGFMQCEEEGVLFYRVPQLQECARFNYIFTTRVGGVSKGDYSSLNLSVTRENSTVNRKMNYSLATKAAQTSPDNIVLVNYAHGTGIELVTAEDGGDGLLRPATLPKCDALVVSSPGVTALTLHADCVPVVVADPFLAIGATAHAGWRGTLGGLPRKLIQYFVRQFGSKPHELICAVGPHIRACCFEVSEDVAAEFETEFGSCTTKRRSGEKPHVDLEAAILLQLASTGIRPKNVTVADLCTYCEEQLFYSHRRDKGMTGAMGSFMQVTQ